MIYVASPYTENPQANFELVEAFVAEQCKVGHLIFSPIVHWHEIARKFDLPKDFEFWQRHNRAMLAKATALWVFCIPGWINSRGVTEEIKFAEQCEIPVTYIHLPLPQRNS